MRIVYFAHSLRSCWNNGNAHFQRGVLRELSLRGHQVRALEPASAWSRHNLVRERGESAVRACARHYPELTSLEYVTIAEAEAELTDADVVIVHEWNDPALVASVGSARRAGARFVALLHDTHHRAVSETAAMRAYDLSGYDAILAFGESIADVYRGWGWGDRVFVWHEAADTRLFKPPAEDAIRRGLVWIGNWGDDERGAELERFLLRPAHALGLPTDIYGVRYPAEALARLLQYGARYCGWLPNVDAPAVFARHLATVHVPRRFYADALPGIPTIRVFEALACGIPLISAPWSDSENLFRGGVDFLMVRSEAEMCRRLHDVNHDPALRASLAAHGLETIRRRHTCGHRADELLGVVRTLTSTSDREAA